MRATEVDFIESSFYSSPSGNKLDALLLYTFFPKYMTSAFVRLRFPFIYIAAILSHSEIGILSKGFSFLSWPRASEKDIIFSKASSKERNTELPASFSSDARICCSFHLPVVRFADANRTYQAVSIDLFLSLSAHTAAESGGDRECSAELLVRLHGFCLQKQYPLLKPSRISYFPSGTLFLRRVPLGNFLLCFLVNVAELERALNVILLLIILTVFETTFAHIMWCNDRTRHNDTTRRSSEMGCKL